ncbi:MAG TPA: oxygenase MpaB family protein, partial [Myxococcota bacterium]
MAEVRVLDRFRGSLLAQLETAGGRHDEPAIYDGEPGDPGLAGGPGSLSWEIHGDLASLVVGGTGAILMEVLHPSVMAGVFTQSSYRTEPLRRARNTLGYVLRTTFGSTPAATRVIEGVRNVHARVRGTRADGVAYQALDPELIAWVHTCIPWAVMNAFDRYRRPLGVLEKNRYLAEQALIGRMGGADCVPETVSELEDYVERMRPRLGVNEQTRSFLDFLAGRTDDFTIGRRERFDRW